MLPLPSHPTPGTAAGGMVPPEIYKAQRWAVLQFNNAQKKRKFYGEGASPKKRRALEAESIAALERHRLGPSSPASRPCTRRPAAGVSSPAATLPRARVQVAGASSPIAFTPSARLPAFGFILISSL